jgi:hypothetical protein
MEKKVAKKRMNQQALEVGPSDRRRLRALKIVVVVLFACLLCIEGTIPNRWPFVWWNLYAGERGWPQNNAANLELRILDTSDLVHRVQPRDLYDILYKPAARRLGANVMRRAFNNKDSRQRAEYQKHLVEHLREKLNHVAISEIQVWVLYWVDFDIWAAQPFEYSKPDRVQKAAVFHVERVSAE